jgi:hypothetical protein
LPAADRTAPLLSVTPVAASRASLARGLRLRLSCSEACTVDVRVLLSAAQARRLGLRPDHAVAVGVVHADVPSTGRSVVLHLSRTGKLALKRIAGVRFSVRATARDASANRSRESSATLRPRR